MKLIAYLLFCLTLVSFQNRCTAAVYVNSLPKSGSHLLLKLVCHMLNMPFKHIDSSNNFFESVTVQNNDFVIFRHTPFYQNVSDHLKKHKTKTLFIYRDPRDRLVSAINHIHNSPWVEPGIVDYVSLSFDELFRREMEEKPTPYLVNYYDYYPWISSTHACCTSFEKLIGSRGGGDDEQQLQEIKKIAEYLELSYTQDELKTIATHLFGGSETFKTGQIGQWKKHFKQHHKEVFKKKYGLLLIQLGYEQDENW